MNQNHNMATNLELQQRIEKLEADLAKVTNYTSNLGGSLEFKNLVKNYAKETLGDAEDSTINDLTVKGKIKHTGTTIGFFSATPASQQASITTPSGGATIDAESRTAIGEIKTAITNLGLTS